MLDKKLMHPGDILLYRVISSSGWSAKFIGWGQKVIGHAPTKKTEYCHVALVAFDTEFVMEAVWPKTRIHKIEWEKWDKEYDLQLFRVKNVTPKQIVEALTWAEDHLGEWYDVLELLGGWINFKHCEICSTYVQKAWKAAGIDFKVNKNNFVTPDEIASSLLIERIQ